MDNPAAHKSPKAEQDIKACGAWILLLQPRPQSHRDGLRQAQGTPTRAGFRTIDVLWPAIGDICDLFVPVGCRKVFSTAGYGYI